MSPYVEETELGRDGDLGVTLAYSVSESVEGEDKTQEEL